MIPNHLIHLNPLGNQWESGWLVSREDLEWPWLTLPASTTGILVDRYYWIRSTNYIRDFEKTRKIANLILLWWKVTAAVFKILLCRKVRVDPLHTFYLQQQDVQFASCMITSEQHNILMLYVHNHMNGFAQVTCVTESSWYASLKILAVNKVICHELNNIVRSLVMKWHNVRYNL